MSLPARRFSFAPEYGLSEVPENPIDVQIPYRTRIKESARHFGFFPFFAKKPWPVVQEYIKHYTNPGDLVCDPFVGSGVTAVESLVLHRRTVASDINPVARFITYTTAVAPVDLDALDAAYQQVVLAVQDRIEALDNLDTLSLRDLLRDLDYPSAPIPSTVRRQGATTTDELHTPRQLAGLALLRQAIAQVEEPVSRDLLKVGLANTVRYANRTYAGRGPENRGSKYRGNANFLRRFSYSLASPSLFEELPVWPTFERVYKAVKEGKAETNRLIGNWYSPLNFRLEDVSASHLYEIVGEGVVDYCFTDPPYSNDIHFVDLSTLWAVWLDLPITDDTRKAELLIDTRQGKSRELFEREFAASMESVARMLKEERWFTLVYKQRDLGLWQTIVEQCEANGLRYVNSVWQEVPIKSTRQNENPNINPQGDMYLNFRKMPRRKFEDIYRPGQITQLPTRPNYVEHEVERIIVSYLGAGIDLITSSVIQQVLDSRAFWDYHNNPDGLRDDIQKVLSTGKFVPWTPRSGFNFWIMQPGTSLDSSLPNVDRARYHAFELLRTRGTVAEGEVVHYVLTRLAEERGEGAISVDVPSLLRNIAQEIELHRWSLDSQKVTDYQQLRMLFAPSIADELRESIEQRSHVQTEAPLRLDLEGIALLRDRLREVNSNTANKQFDAQYQRLQSVLRTVLWRLKSHFDRYISYVHAVGDWALLGVDLRLLKDEDVVLNIVVQDIPPSFELYTEIAEHVFTDLGDDDILVQFQLETVEKWNHVKAMADMRDQTHLLGVSLMTRQW